MFWTRFGVCKLTAAPFRIKLLGHSDPWVVLCAVVSSPLAVFPLMHCQLHLQSWDSIVMHRQKRKMFASCECQLQVQIDCGNFLLG